MVYFLPLKFTITVYYKSARYVLLSWFCCIVFFSSELVVAYYVIEKVDLKREKVLN